MIWNTYFKNKITSYINQYKYRKRIVVHNKTNRLININQVNYINFSSNDYLGLSKDSRVIRAWKNSADRYGIGSTGSSFLTGYSKIHQSLEKKLAQWLNYPKALLFISGFSANSAIISALINKNDRIFADKLSHASLIASSYNSLGKLYRFLHNDINSLKYQFNSSLGEKSLIITEGLFSMDGDYAPLKSIHEFSKKTKSLLLVDDAHGIGILGHQGKGSCSKQHIKPDILTITFGKAFGISGAAVLCNENIAEYLSQFSKQLIYSTSMPIAQVYAIKQALYCIKKSDYLRQKLKNNIKLFTKKVTHLPFLKNSKSVIQPIILGENAKAIQLSLKLQSKGIWANAIRSPTVPNNKARLRITLNCMHTENDINYLVDILNEFYDQKK